MAFLPGPLGYQLYCTPLPEDIAGDYLISQNDESRQLGYEACQQVYFASKAYGPLNLALLSPCYS
jgi:hypothetical protein